jgi:GT2 family glycosyltransferase
MGAPDVSVVVVSWRTRDFTLACLRSVERAAEGSRLEVETILVDNASGDGTVEAVARKYPRVSVVASERNLGFAAGCNAALPRCRGRYVLLLNPDAEITAEALAALVSALDRAPDAAAAGGRLVTPSGEPHFSCGRFLTPLNQSAESLGLSRFLPGAAFRRSYREKELHGDAVDVDWIVGACLLLRREPLEQVGGLDDRFFMFVEDEDLCFRLREAGWRVLLLPAVSVTHVGGASTEQAIEPMREAMRESQAAFVRKHHGRASELLFRLVARLASLKPRRRPNRVGWGN